MAGGLLPGAEAGHGPRVPRVLLVGGDLAGWLELRWVTGWGFPGCSTKGVPLQGELFVSGHLYLLTPFTHLIPLIIID